MEKWRFTLWFHQTWLAGKSSLNGGFTRKITDEWSIFQQAMFDYWRVLENNNVLLVKIEGPVTGIPSSSSLPVANGLNKPFINQPTYGKRTGLQGHLCWKTTQRKIHHVFLMFPGSSQHTSTYGSFPNATISKGKWQWPWYYSTLICQVQ